MPQMSEEEAEARSLGLALLDASSIYEGYVIPTFEGHLRRRPFPPHRRAIIGLVGRQRRFLRAVHTLADAGQMLEAIGPLRSMLEFLVCQRWLAKIQTATGNSGWQTTTPPATCGASGSANMDRRCTTPRWHRP